MARNGISTLPTKQARQIAKLELAAAKRGQSYNIDLLPTKYDGNTVVNNPNVGGLVAGRPWTDSPMAPTFSVAPRNATVNEGGNIIVDITTTNFPNGDVVYFTVSGVLAGDISSGILPSGDTTVNNGTSSVSFNLSEDSTTEGVETLVFEVRTGSTSGPIVATCNVTINDTSLALVPPFSLQFVQSQTDYLDVAASTDWGLSTTWTIEWWNKSAKASGAGDLLTVMCQNFQTSGIQILYQEGFQIQGSTVIAAEPTPGVWIHVALVSDGSNLKLYYNGVDVYTGSAWNISNTTDAIRIGARGTADFQRFDGKLAMIRISNTAKYTTAFTATTSYGVETDTKLFLSSDTPLVDSKSHTITNNGVTESTDFPVVTNTLVALQYNQNNGYASNQGTNQICVLIADYPDIVNVPNGASVTVTGTGSGTYTVSGVTTISGVRLLAGPTSGTAWGSDTLTFTWTA